MKTMTSRDARHAASRRTSDLTRRHTSVTRTHHVQCKSREGKTINTPVKAGRDAVKIVALRVHSRSKQKAVKILGLFGHEMLADAAAALCNNENQPTRLSFIGILHPSARFFSDFIRELGKAREDFRLPEHSLIKRSKFTGISITIKDWRMVPCKKDHKKRTEH